MNSLESFAKYMPSGNSTALTTITANVPILTDVEAKARRLTNSLTDVMYEVSNEPSLGFYRIQEHVRKGLPAMIGLKSSMEEFETNLKGSRFDLDYSTEAVHKMSTSNVTFDSIQNILDQSLKSAHELAKRIQRPVNKVHAAVSPESHSGRPGPSSAPSPSTVPGAHRLSVSSVSSSSGVRRRPAERTPTPQSTTDGVES